LAFGWSDEPSKSLVPRGSLPRSEAVAFLDAAPKLSCEGLPPPLQRGREGVGGSRYARLRRTLPPTVSREREGGTLRTLPPASAHPRARLPRAFGAHLRRG